MNRPRILLALGVIFVAAGLVACDNSPQPTGEKITLKLNMAKGDQKKLVYDMDMDIAVGANGENINMAMNMGMTFGVNVDNVDDKGLHTLSMGFDRIKMSADVAGQKMSYDSTNPDAGTPALSAAFKAFKGKSMTVKMTPDGTTTDVAGFDELIADADPAAKAQLQQQANGMKGSFGQMLGHYPTKPVDIRDTWTGTMSMAQDPNMPMDVKVKYTLHDRQNGKAIIKIDGTIDSSAGLSGTMTGTITMDEKTGWTEKADMNMTVDGEVQGAKMDMDAKITVKG